jgi:protoporphyrinogen oxidase
MTKRPIIVGAGPAGLTAGYELLKRGVPPLILEKTNRVGGIARTEVYKGYRLDIGGHRFYTKVDEVERVWHEVLGPEFLLRPRLSRIYYQGKFYQYPLNLINTLGNLGFWESGLILLSYLRWQLLPHCREDNFEEWVTNRFGRRLYKTFFQTYTEKVWGIPCHTIQADWAAQRIKDLSLRSAVSNALFNSGNVKSLIEQFHYPRLGPGMMWERMQQLIERKGGEVHLNAGVEGLQHENGRIHSLTIRQGSQTCELEADQVISSMPVSHLLLGLDPAPPQAVLHAARSLKYRDFLIVGLIVNHPNLFPDNWIYIHNPDVKVGRIQNFKNWSAAMVPHPAMTCLGMEYFCNEGDPLWTMDDDGLIQLAAGELSRLGLANANLVEDGLVIRQRKAYPVYDQSYRTHVTTVQTYLAGFSNLQTVGRNGMHRYNNQDHSMLTGLLAAKNVLGEQHELWEVNTERSYYEEVLVKPAPPSVPIPRPQPLASVNVSSQS